MLWIIPTLGVLGTIVWFANGLRKISAVSSGQPIGERSGTALLLIDLQPAFWDAGTYSDTAKAQARAHILAEVEAAKSNEIPIIAARHEWSIPSTKAVARVFGKGLAIEGTSGTEVLAPFDGLVDHVVTKRVQDAFETGELDRLLQSLDIGRLLILGLDTNHCVAKTALAARQRGHDVDIAVGGILAADKRKSQKTIEMLREKQVTVR